MIGNISAHYLSLLQMSEGPLKAGHGLVWDTCGLMHYCCTKGAWRKGYIFQWEGNVQVPWKRKAEKKKYKMSYTLTLRASLVSLLIHACPYIISGEEGENKTFLGIAFLNKKEQACQQHCRIYYTCAVEDETRRWKIYNTLLHAWIERPKVKLAEEYSY